MVPEDYILILLPLIWGTFFGIPFIGIRISPHRRRLFEKISNHYFKFASIFTVGSFIILIGEEQWKNILNFLLSGHMYILCIGIPGVLIMLSFYYIYKIWRDLLYELREEEEE